MTTERQKMKERVEILVEIEIDTNGPSEAEALRIARHKLARVAESGQFRVVGTAPLTREQSRAVRLATAAAKNGGSMPQTMEDMAGGVRAILGGPDGSWFVADSSKHSA